MKDQAPQLEIAFRMRVRAVAGCILLLALTARPSVTVAEDGSRYAATYPEAASKKGLQVELLDDALALGIKHAALNVNLSQLVVPNADDGDHLYPFRSRPP